LSNGTIVSRIKLSTDQVIEDYRVVGQKIFAFYTQKTNPKILFISGFIYNTRPQKQLNAQFQVNLNRNKPLIKILQIHDSNIDLVLLKQVDDTNSLEIYKLCYTSLTNHNGDILEPDALVDLSKHVVDNKFLDNLTVIISKSQKIVLCIEFELILIDLVTSQVVLKHNISNQMNSLKYFLSPTNLTSNSFLQLEPIHKSNCLIGLDNLKNLNFISYQDQSNSIQTFNNDYLVVESFKISEKFLIAYDKADNQLIGFDLRIFLETKKNPLRNVTFKLSLTKNASNLNHYGISSDCKNLFTVVANKKLVFYRLSDLKLTGEMALYSSVGEISCSDKFVCMTTEDRRVISYMICDSEDPKSKIRIKKLASR